MNYRRLDNIVILRCFATILVVLGHCMCMFSSQWRILDITVFEPWQFVTNIIYRVHMPIFSMIAGYVYLHIRNGGGYNSWRDFLIKKSKRLIIPLLVWSIIENYIDGPFDIFTLLFGPLHLWYLSYLFEAFIITRLLDKFLVGHLMNSFVLSVSFFIFKDIVHIGTDNYLYPIIKLYPYMLCGIFLYNMNHNSRYMKVISHKMLYTITIIAFVMLLASTYCGKFNTGFIFNILLFISATSFSLPSHIPRLLLDFDKCSMGIYLMHHPIIWNIAKYDISRNFMYEYLYISPLILTIFVVLITWYISHYILNNKYFHYILG